MTVRFPPLRRACRAVRRLAGDVRAATAVEYGLICALIVLAMMATFMEVAKSTTGMWNNVNNKVEQAH